MNPSRDSAVISFPEWQQRLHRAALAGATAGRYEHAILAFLHYCKIQHAPVTVALIRQYLEREAGAREALRWFYREAAYTASPTRQAAVTDRRDGGVASPGTASGPRAKDVPPLAADDQGGADWERDLVAAIRMRGFLWRTEETYRAWGVRFAAFLKTKSPYAATDADLGAFLTDLAVRQRATPSTQKQALNALVFLLREALHRQLGEIPFRRAYPRRRIPTVLTKEECAHLFEQLDGTNRLMAELAYGAGLRLMELLRLRVQHVDFDRRQLTVAGGKGDKDRVTVLPDRLVAPLRAHVDRLRGLHVEDRAAGLAGVWLPEGLARKYPKAGERFQWQWLCCSLAAL